MTRQRGSDREEIGLVAFMGERVERSRKRGRKRLPQDNCVLPRTAEQMIRRIVKATAEGSETWAEANNEVARALHVDRSTVVRMVRRLCAVGILTPVETKGGRGRVSVYGVDRLLAEEVLRSRRWPVAPPNRGVEEAQEEGQKAGQREEPALRMPPFHEKASSDRVPPSGARRDHDPNSDRVFGGYSFLGALDPSVLACLAGEYGNAADPPAPARIRQWWEAQPDSVRRAVGATAVGTAVVAAAALLGGWRAAAIAALVSTPLATAYALAPGMRTSTRDAAAPPGPAGTTKVTAGAEADPLFFALAKIGSRPAV